MASDNEAAAQDEIARAISQQDYEAQTAEARARIQYQIDYSQTLLNALMVGNGGSIIALLTFIGNTGSKVEPAKMQSAFILYAAGLALVFVAYMAAFFSQFFMYNAAQYMAWFAQARAQGGSADYDVAGQVRWGNVSIAIGVFAALFSLGAFVWGSVSALKALT